MPKSNADTKTKTNAKTETNTEINPKTKTNANTNSNTNPNSNTKTRPLSTPTLPNPPVSGSGRVALASVSSTTAHDTSHTNDYDNELSSLSWVLG